MNLYQILIREIFTMCQTNRDYQSHNEKYKGKILHRDIVTYFGMVAVLKSILTGTHHPLMKYVIKQVQSQQNGNLNPNLLNSSDVSNPYSHLLCFRLLKDSFIKVDYGLLILIQAQLVDLMYRVSIFNSAGQNQQRGKDIYLQGFTSQRTVSKLSMSIQELEVVGFSVHKIAMETLMTLGSSLRVIPYHPSKTSKNSQTAKQESNLTERLALTPRLAANLTFQNQFQKLKMRTLNDQLKKYPQNLISSLSGELYQKTRQMKVKYPQRLHYYKQKQIQKFKKQCQFNSENKLYHVLKFYEIFIALVIRQQVDINQKVLQATDNLNQSQFRKFRTNFSEVRRNGFLDLLIKIMSLNDRYSIYFTVIYLVNALEVISVNKNKDPSENRVALKLFFSLCEIIDNLLVNIKKPQETRVRTISNFNLQFYLAFEQIIIKFLVDTYLCLFGCIQNKQQRQDLAFCQYVRNSFYYFICKWDSIRAVFLQNNKQNSEKQNLTFEPECYFKSSQSLLKRYRANIDVFYKNKRNARDFLKNSGVSIIDQQRILRMDSLKDIFSFQISQVSIKELQVQRGVLLKIKRQAELVDKMDVVLLASQRCKFHLNYRINLTSIHQQHDLALDNLFLQSLKYHQKLKNQRKQERQLQKAKQKQQNKHVSLKDLRLKGENGRTSQVQMQNQRQFQSQFDIPDQQGVRQHSINKYRLNINSNDISKINFRSTSSLSKDSSEKVKSSLHSPAQGIHKLSFTQNLKISEAKLNLINRDVQTLRNNSRRKYLRKHSNTRLCKIDDNCSEALSCPTYNQIQSIQQLSQNSYQNILTQKQIRKSKQYVKAFQSQQSVTGFNKSKQRQSGAKQSQISEIQYLLDNYSSPLKKLVRKVTNLPKYKNCKKNVIQIKDSITMQVHQINIQGQGLAGQTNKTNLSQEFGKLMIKDTDSYVLDLNHLTPTNRTKNKSRFNQSQEQLEITNQSRSNIKNQQKKLDITNAKKQSLSSRNNSFMQKGTMNSNERAQKNHLHQFNFTVKMKKEILKKKILIIKDQLIQVGMITHIEKCVASDKSSNLAKQQKVTNKYSQFKLKSTIYITPLVKLKKIQIDIKCHSWIRCQILTNKQKVNLKADSQYVSLIQFYLQSIKIQKQLNHLPELNIMVQGIKKQKQDPGLNSSNKYNSLLPIFVSKFFNEDGVDVQEKSKLVQILNSQSNNQWIQISTKVIKQFKDLQKYFSKLQPQYMNHRITFLKIIFLGQQVYICFRNRDYHNLESKALRKGSFDQLDFQIFFINQIRGRQGASQMQCSQKLKRSNLVLMSWFSLLTQ